MYHAIKFITLIVGLTLVFSAPVFGQSYFLDIPNIPGEVDEADYMEQICITSFSWEVESSITSGGGGGGSGVARAGEFKFGKSFDRASPLLFGAVTSGQTFPELTFSIVVPDGMGRFREFAEYKLKDVRIIGFQPGGESDSIPKEVISLIAEEVEITHFLYGANGQLEGKTSYSWNFATNTGG